jgi:KDO2-lipid IV(A) lauroyltransferase
MSADSVTALAPRLGRRVRLGLEAAAVRLAAALFGALPLDAASAFGGFIGRTIGPRLGVSRRARRNLARAFPDLDRAAIERIVVDMWDNLGRTAAELPHLGQIVSDEGPGRVEVMGIEHVRALANDGKPGIFFAGHLANWELLAPVALAHGVRLSMIYRMANNQASELAIQKARGGDWADYMPKGASTARRIVDIMRKGGHVALLADQKTNNGIAVPFFGRDAMTTPIIGLCAQRFDCPVVPAQAIRLKGARFRVVAHPPLDLPRGADGKIDVRAATALINATIEGWVRANPAQWMWLHHRWPD